MASVFKVALLGMALAAPLAMSAEASAPQSHEAKAMRAPAARLETPVAQRYARARASMNDGWDSWDDEDRPRVSRKAKRQQARRHVQAPRQARRHVVRSYDGEEVQRPQRRAGRKAAAYVPSGSAGSGIASYYWQGQRTASGAHFNPEGLTAAHRTLPFGTRVRVTNAHNGRSVDVTINDRGPFIAGRVIDLSRGAARVIGMTGQGLARVNVEVLGR